MEQKEYDICIIGAGVVGCALARYLTRFKFSIAVVEKEADVGDGISRANSGVLHAGFNVPPGSLKAKLNVEGVGLFTQIAKDLDVEYSVCGKIVTAKTLHEKKTLDRLLNWGNQNKCIGLSMIGHEEAVRLQPGIVSTSALFSQNTSVFSPYKYTIALAENARQNGAEFYTETEICKLDISGLRPRAITTDGTVFQAKWLINAAGLGAADLARAIDPTTPRVYPVRGQYQILDKSASSHLKLAVYPVPPEDGKGLGIHLTPTPEGNILIGPSAECINTSLQTDTTIDVQEMLSREAKELLTTLKSEKPIRVYSGIRPKLTPPGSSEFKDYYIERSSNHPNVIHLLGIESPGLTAAPAIARYIVHSFISKENTLTPNDNFNPKLIQPKADGIKYPNEILCRCEEIRRQEIADAFLRLFGPVSVQAIKKRTRVTGGRCQGGYCLVRLLPFLQEEFGVQANEIPLRGRESILFLPDSTVISDEEAIKN